MATVRSNKPIMSTNRRAKVSEKAALGNRVLAERNQPAVAVGTWVESGTELRQHPSTQASLTEELQEESRRRIEQTLREFQQTVRLRVAHQVRRNRERRLMLSEPPVTLGGAASRQLQEFPKTGTAPSGDRRDRSFSCNGRAQAVESAAVVRLHLSSSQSKPSHAAAQQSQQDDSVSPDSHRCVLVQHKVRGHVKSHFDQSQPEVSASRVLWPLDCTEELRRQRQAHILMQRRLFMNREREHVKENQQRKRHIQRTASLKSEKERVRLEEERRLERACVLSQAQQTVEQREQLVQERLRLEAADRGGEPECTRHCNKPKTLPRLIDILRAQLRELSLGSGTELPPLCCCGSFWESHPNTCANNCVFHNNPKAYVQALQAAIHSWDLH